MECHVIRLHHPHCVFIYSSNIILLSFSDYCSCWTTVLIICNFRTHKHESSHILCLLNFFSNNELVLHPRLAPLHGYILNIIITNTCNSTMNSFSHFLFSSITTSCLSDPFTLTFCVTSGFLKSVEQDRIRNSGGFVGGNTNEGKKEEAEGCRENLQTEI